MTFEQLALSLIATQLHAQVDTATWKREGLAGMELQQWYVLVPITPCCNVESI